MYHLDNDEYGVKTVVTDRSKSISKGLREQRPDINHKYDPWHFPKNIKGKLRPLSKRKDCKTLAKWIKPIGHHIFFCA